MADKSPKGSRNSGGGSLIGRSRHWDEGSPKAFQGSIHPAMSGPVTAIKDAARVNQPSAKGKPPATGLGDTAKIGVKFTQSAKAPKMNAPQQKIGGGKATGKPYHNQIVRAGTDKGPRG